MENISTFLIVFIGIVVVVGWISSEMISRKATQATKKSSLRASKLERENNELTIALQKEQERYKRLREEYEKAKEAREQLREFEREYMHLVNAYNRFSANIDDLKKLVTEKKYKSNALSREILSHMERNCPSSETLQKMKDESTKEAFKRIKERMKSGL